MRVDLFDFDLPPERIALKPASPRDAARMLVVAPDGGLDDAHVFDLPRLLRPGDALVVNDTRVIAARLDGIRVRGAAVAAIEATLIKRLDASRWRALVKPAKKLKVGERIRFGETRESTACLLAALDAEVEAKGEGGEVTLRFAFHGAALDEAIDASARRRCRPISPRADAIAPSDRADYQTMFAREEGAVAAPTAGLHFTPELIARVEAAGARLFRLTLHVGAGTFLPVKADDTAGHAMHAGMGSARRGDRRGAQCDARARRPDRRRRHDFGAAARKRRRRGRRASRLRRRDGDLHHARLSLPRRRRAADQFPSAALDAVHAGLRLQRPRDDEARLRPCDRRGLSLLFLRRRLPAARPRR